MLRMLSYQFKNKGDFKNNAPISLINVYRLSKADLLLKLILRYVINVFLHHVKFHRFKIFCSKVTWKNVIKIVARVTLFCDISSLTFDSAVNCIKHYACGVKW